MHRLDEIIRSPVHLKQMISRWNLWLISIPSTNQQWSSEAFNVITIWIFRPPLSTRIDDVAHRPAADRLSYTFRQVCVVSAAPWVCLFQGLNEFCHCDNIRNTKKECFSDDLRSIRWHGLYILAWSSRTPVQQTDFAKGFAGPIALVWCPCFSLDCERIRHRSNPDLVSNILAPYPRQRLPRPAELSTRQSDLRSHWNERLCDGCGWGQPERTEYTL